MGCFHQSLSLYFSHTHPLIHTHAVGDFDMSFGDCEREACAIVPIIDDSSVEDTKTHIIRLRRPDDLDQRIQLTTSSAMLTIYDDSTDGEKLFIVCCITSTRNKNSSLPWYGERQLQL